MPTVAGRDMLLSKIDMSLPQFTLKTNKAIFDSPAQRDVYTVTTMQLIEATCGKCETQIYSTPHPT